MSNEKSKSKLAGEPVEKPTGFIARFRAQLERDLQNLKELIAAHGEIGKSLGAADGTLQAARDEVARLASEKNEIDSLTPLDLARRKLSAEDAVAKSDDLKKQLESAQSREASLNDRTQDRSNIITAIHASLNQLNYDCRLLVEAEFLAEMGSMIDLGKHYLPILVEQTGDHLFNRTRAGQIYQDRSHQIKFIKTAGDKESAVLKVAEGIVAEPFIPLRAAPPALPHGNNSVVVRSLIQRLGEAPVYDSAVFRGLPPGQTSEDIKNEARNRPTFR